MPRKILIIDANNMMWRAFYAMDRLTYNGQSTHAVKGLLNKIGECVGRYAPTHTAVCFDGGGRGPRHDLYPDYKISRLRSSKDKKKQRELDDFRVQAKLARQLVRLLGYHVAHKKGVEADDWIGSYCRAAGPADDVVVVSGDKDFNVLLRKTVRIWNGKDPTELTVSRMRKRYGVTPEQFHDYLALVGDGVDDIPGVVGIGPGTAQKLIAEYGDLRSIWKARKSLTGIAARIRQSSWEHIKLQRQLVGFFIQPTEPWPQLRQPKPRKQLSEEQRRKLDSFNRKHLGFWKGKA